jgi:hypothetical protein
MHRTLLRVLSPTLCVLLLAPAAEGKIRKRHLWATVNVCDTKSHPDMMGVRARMPGNGKRGRMDMRFVAQYRSSAGWRRVSGRGTSGWLRAGSSRFRFEELGFTFEFDPPAAGTTYEMRGKVQFRWRARNGRVRLRKRRITADGHPSRGADPKRFSAARCTIE